MPQLQFSSYGVIASYSALTIVRISPLQAFGAHISFSIWRPKGNGLYDLVGSNNYTFIRERLEAELLGLDGSPVPPDADNIEYGYFRFQREEIQDDPLSFQPRDILGWNAMYKPTPLFLAYKNADETERSFTSYTVPSQEPLCSVSQYGVTTTNISSIIPYIVVHYSKCLV